MEDIAVPGASNMETHTEKIRKYRELAEEESMESHQCRNNSDHPVQQRPCPQGSEEWTKETETAGTPRDQDAEISND